MYLLKEGGRCCRWRFAEKHIHWVGKVNTPDQRILITARFIKWPGNCDNDTDMIFSLQAGFEQQLLSPQSVNPSGDIYYDDYDDDYD